MADLFSDITIRGKRFKNRIKVAPMLVCDVSVSDGVVNEEYLNHYRWLCGRGTGAIVSGALAVTPTGMMAPPQLGVWDDKFIDGLSQFAPICQANDVRHIAMLNHAGFRSYTDDPIGPSEHVEGDKKPTRAMTLDELKGLQQDYINAAVRVQKAGFDGALLQCSHMYLIDEFFSSVPNQRTDDYGGSIENRARFATEIVTEIRKRCGEDFIISCRMGCQAPTLEDSIAIAKLMIAAGVDNIDISWSTVGLALVTAENLPKPDGFPHSGLVYGASQMKKNLDVPIGAVWEITSDKANDVIEKGYADFVDVLRPLLVDPDWVQNAKAGKASITCLNCKPVCKWFQSRTLCPRWLKLPEEARLNL